MSRLMVGVGGGVRVGARVGTRVGVVRFEKERKQERKMRSPLDCRHRRTQFDHNMSMRQGIPGSSLHAHPRIVSIEDYVSHQVQGRVRVSLPCSNR